MFFNLHFFTDAKEKHVFNMSTSSGWISVGPNGPGGSMPVIGDSQEFANWGFSPQEKARLQAEALAAIKLALTQLKADGKQGEIECASHFLPKEVWEKVKP